MSRPERVVAADNEVQELVAKARKAQAVYEAFSQEQVDAIVRGNTGRVKRGSFDL